MAKTKLWTEAEDELLIAKVREGETLAELARRLRRSKNAVNQRLCLLKRKGRFAGRRVQRPLPTQVSDLYSLGYSPAEIAETTGLSGKTVRAELGLVQHRDERPLLRCGGCLQIKFVAEQYQGRSYCAECAERVKVTLRDSIYRAVERRQGQRQEQRRG